jgi:hypothetical protein
MRDAVERISGSWNCLRSQSRRSRRRRRRLKALRASTKIATASTQTGAAVEPAPSITAGIAVVSSECREAAKKANRHCEHGRRKRRCKDCGTGYCKHGREKSRCKDCGTGHCQHGRQEHQCKDCGAGARSTQTGAAVVPPLVKREEHSIGGQGAARAGVSGELPRCWIYRQQRRLRLRLGFQFRMVAAAQPTHSPSALQPQQLYPHQLQRRHSLG